VVATTARSALERWLGDTYFTTTANANAATNNINSSQSRNDNLNVNGPTTTTMTSNNGNNNSPNNNDNSADNESDDEDEDEWARLTISTASGIDNIMTPTNINSTNLPLETMANLATANALATTELLNARLFEHISGGSGSGSGADNDTVGAAVERVGSGVTASAAAAAAVGPPDSFASLYALNYGIGGAPAGTTTAFASSASRSNIGGSIDITSSSTRSSFTPVSSTSQSTSPPPQSTTLPAHQRRQQQRLRDYQRQQQQQQLRHYERQYQQRLRSNLITASMSSSISRQQQRQRELMQEFGEGSRSSGQQHTQTQQQQRQPTHHPYLPRTSRSSLQSIERARSLAGIRERRLQREQNNNNHHLEEQFSTSDWNTYQSVRAELNDRRTAADAAADAALNDDDGGEGEDDDVESVEIDIESFEGEEDSGTNDEEYPFINDLVNDYNRRAIANNRSTGVIIARSNWDPHQTIRRGITEEHERTGREYREIAIEWVRLGRAEFIPGIGRLGDLPPLSLNHGGGEDEEEEELPILEDNEFSLFASARPPSSASDNSSNMPGLQPMDQEGSDGGSPSTATTTTAASSSAASSASPVVANVPTSTTNTAVPTRRSRRQAAVQCMERISAAIATGGMGSDYNNDSADESKKQPTTKKSPSSKKAPPSEVAGKPSAIFSKTATCCICLEVPTEEELSAINGCDHPYCFTCIETWANRENTCPLCKARFTNIEKVNFKSSKRKRGGGEMSSSSSERKSKKVRTRNQRADINMSNPLQGLFASIEASGALPAQIAQLLFSGLGGPTFGGRPRPSAAAAAASRASSRSTSTTAAASTTSAAAAAASRPSTQSRFSQRGPMHMTTTSITLPPILDMPTLDPFGLSSVPSFGSPFGGTFGGGPPTPWNSSPPSSSASPFSYRSSAASRARSQGAAAAAATAASSPFNYPGSSFEGFLARHDDDLFRSLSSPTPPSSQHHASHQRRSGGTTSRTREFDFDSFGREAHPYTMRMRMRNLEEERRGRGSAAPSSRSSISNRSRPSSRSGTNNRSPAPAAAAGTSRETALEIHDSDDEVVEVIDLVS